MPVAARMANAEFSFDGELIGYLHSSSQPTFSCAELKELICNGQVLISSGVRMVGRDIVWRKPRDGVPTNHLVAKDGGHGAIRWHGQTNTLPGAPLPTLRGRPLRGERRS